MNCVFRVSRPTVISLLTVSFSFLFFFFRFATGLSVKQAAKSVIDFCQADRILSCKSLASYFQSKKRKSEVVKNDR